MNENKPSALIEKDGYAVKKLIAFFRDQSRQKRIRLFHKYFSITEHFRILDLGGWDGSHINALLWGVNIEPSNIFVADINIDAIQSANSNYGFTPIHIPEHGILPFPDGYFDLIFCSSVLEHVTVPKEEIWNIQSGQLFRSMSITRQRQFALEIKRLGRAYFVQVPYRWFPIETHSWIPFLTQLPRKLQIQVLMLSNRFWIKQTSPDFYLPSKKEMYCYFPEGEIIWETQFGFRKSLIAIKTK